MKKTISTISQEVFSVSLVTYLIFLLAEYFQQGFITDFFNINILLGVALISGVTLTFTNSNQESKSNPITLNNRKNTLSPFIISFVVGLLVYFKLQSQEIPIIISILASIVSLILSLLILS